MIIQIILVALSVLFTVYLLSSRKSHAINAWKKIGVIGIGVIAVLSITFPSLTNTVANLLGVGRGADLLLYLFVASFIFYVLSQYLKQQEQRDAIYRLARQIAVSDAQHRYADKIKK